MISGISTKYFGEIPVFYELQMAEIYKSKFFEKDSDSYCFLFHSISIKKGSGKIPAILREKSRSFLGKQHKQPAEATNSFDSSLFLQPWRGIDETGMPKTGKPTRYSFIFNNK